MGVVCKQHQRSQAGRANRVAFGHGLGGVAHGIKWVGHGAYLGRQLSHFGNAAGVVCDRTVGIERHHNAGHAQHRRSCNRNAEQACQFVRHQNSNTDKNHGPGGRTHRHAQAGNDVGAVAGGRRLRNMLDRSVLRAGVVLGHPDQRCCQDQADGAGAEELHLAAAGGNRVVGHQPGGDEVKRHQ